MSGCSRIWWAAAACLCVELVATTALGQAVKPRIAVLLDTSSSMLTTPEWVTLSSDCSATGFNPCQLAGNPTAAQETCNPCVRDTINFSPTCASSWNASCASSYKQCLAVVTGQTTCSPAMTITTSVTSRGDGSANLQGCDLNGDGVANDSRLYQAKQALGGLFGDYGELEFALWRFAQVVGGQTCTTDAQCPRTPGGLGVLTCEDHDNDASTASRCMLDADVLDAAATHGECAPMTWEGAGSAFNCGQCDFATSYDRAICEAYRLDRIKTTGVSPLNDASIVSCFPTAAPTHRYIDAVGASMNGAACDPTGAQRIVDFPATGFDDSYAAGAAYVDQQWALASNPELRATGGSPIAAALRDMRTSLLATVQPDTRTPCRQTKVVLVLDGNDTCESAANAVTAAGTFQNLAFTNGAGVTISDYDIPVYVVAFSPCPPSEPHCQALIDLDAIAVAGGTGQALVVSNALELRLALAAIADSSLVIESCGLGDSNCDGADNENFYGLGAVCTSGAGQCRTTGNLVCGADQMQLVCNRAAAPPLIEACNFEDDDCDGLVDEGDLQCGL